MSAFDQLDEFTRAYISAALWTSDDGAPSGNYETSGRIEELSPKIHPDNLKKAIDECAKFQLDNAALLARAGTPTQNGHDFWLTRNGHGAGFWDRGYPDDVSDALSNICRKCGERDCTIDADIVYIE